jgi:hypothetical protein
MVVELTAIGAVPVAIDANNELQAKVCSIMNAPFTGH